MPELHFSTDINCPAEDVFKLIADLAHYSRWLPPSGTYAETLDISESPVKAGSTYVDRNRLNTMYGTVPECMPNSRIVFHQATKGPSLDITAAYNLTPTGAGTRVERTTTILTSGWLRLLQPFIVRSTGRENERLLQIMKAYLEKSARS